MTRICVSTQVPAARTARPSRGPASTRKPDVTARAARVVAGYTEDGEPAFEVYGISDVDGDGKTAVYRATPTMAARLETDVNLY